MPQEQNTLCHYCETNCGIPFGFCHCGCGEKTKIEIIAVKRYNRRKGFPQKYVYGHTRRGRPHPPVELCICGNETCTIPYGFCHCGCRKYTKIWEITDNLAGAINGKSQKFILGHTLVFNRTKSVDKQISSRVIHGFNRNKFSNSTYKIWAAMKQRCLNPNNASFPYYGGRGIAVCERWHKFENFLADMGERPEKLSLERINNNGNYEPNNCKWATTEEQSRNKRARFSSTPKVKSWRNAFYCTPKRNEIVIVSIEETTATGFLDGDLKWNIFENPSKIIGGKVTHWTPLPKPFSHKNKETIDEPRISFD